MGTYDGLLLSKLGVRWCGMLQDLLVQRSSDTLRALAELDAAELKRYKQNALMWQVMPLSEMPPISGLVYAVSWTVGASQAILIRIS